MVIVQQDARGVPRARTILREDVRTFRETKGFIYAIAMGTDALTGGSVSAKDMFRFLLRMRRDSVAATEMRPSYRNFHLSARD
jgi:hypothetical protein